jgi:ubiquitin C-terminal hydrolase
MNTFVQCLSHTRRICKAVDNFNENRVQAFGADRGQFDLNLFTDTLQQVMDLHEKALLTQAELAYLLECLLQHPTFANSRPPATAIDQQDVHELLSIFLQEACSTVCEQFNIEFAKTWTCGGPLRHEPLVNFEEQATMLDLKPGRNLGHLVHYINDFLTSSFVDDVICPVCNLKAPCKEVKQLSRLPPILLIHLSRTDYNHHGTIQKITERVECPMTLTLSNPHLNVDYTLYAVVLHRGLGNSGHYKCNLINFLQN